MRSTLLVLFLSLVLVAVSTSPAAAQEAPVLGSPDYVTNGEGFGSVAPKAVYNGGVPSGLVSGIRWTGWGEPTARGEGKGSIYRPQGGYYPRVRIQLRVRDLGACPGRSERAYLTLEFRSPPWPGGPYGSWRKWSGSRTTCDYAETDPAYEYPKLGPGVCNSVGEYGEPGTAQSIATHRMGCGKARSTLRRLARRDRPQRCVKQGCTIRIGKRRCRLAPVHAGETTGFDYPYPLERTVCRRGGATLSAFLVLDWD